MIMDKLTQINDELAKMLHSGLELTLQKLPFPDINLALLFIALVLGLFALLVLCLFTPDEEEPKSKPKQS